MELSLGQKGPVAPPPKLDRPYHIAGVEIEKWDNVIAATHWHLIHRGEVDGIDFYVGEMELGHIHLDGRVHLATNQLLSKELRSKGLAKEFPYIGYEHWVSFTILSKSDADHAIWLFYINYLRLQGVVESELIKLISSHP